MNAYLPAKDWQRNAGQVPAEAKALDLRELGRIFVRRLPIVCGIPFLAVLVAMLIFISLTPRYIGTVAILIDPKTPGSLGPGTDFGTAMMVDSTKIASIGSIIQSSAVLERVVKSEKLYDDPEFGLVRRSFLARLLSKLPGFRFANPSATGENGTSTITTQQITELNAAIGAAEVELSLKQAKVEQARRVRQSGGNIESLPEVMASSVITGLRSQRTDIVRKLAEMQPLPSQHGAVRRPEAIRAEEGLRAIDGQISAEEGRFIANLENDYAASSNNVRALKEQLKKLTGAGGVTNPDGLAKLREAERVANANRQVYDSFLNKFKELEQSQTLQEAEARIIENARVPLK